MTTNTTNDIGDWERSVLKRFAERHAQGIDCPYCKTSLVRNNWDISRVGERDSIRFMLHFYCEQCQMRIKLEWNELEWDERRSKQP